VINGAWKSSTLAELVDDAIGGLWGSPPDSSKPDETDVLVVRGADFRNWNSRRALDAAPRRVPTRSLERRRLAPGDIVLEVSGGSPAQPVGRVLLIDETTVAESPKPLICSNFCRKLHLKPGVDAHFVKRQLDWLYRSGHTDQFQTSTTNIRNLQVDDFLRGTSIVLPDQALQGQLTAIMGRIDAFRDSGSSHIAAARRAVERLRQSIFSAASSGRLTADWRNEHSEDSQPLLRALQAGSSQRRKSVAGPEPDLIDEHPASWDIVVLDLLIDRIEAGKSFSALGRPATPDEWGVVKVSAMSWGSFLEDENKAVPTDRPINPDYEIRTGDLLLSRANTEDLVGATVLVSETRPRLLLSDKSLRLVTRAGIERPWLNYMLQSPLVRGQFSDRATGTSDSMRNLSQVKILSTTLPLPPTEEQREIGRRVDQLLGLADDLKRRLESAHRHVERSSQAVMTKSFRGDLLPTDADLDLVSKEA
jgi:hypothetical protein